MMRTPAVLAAALFALGAQAQTPEPAPAPAAAVAPAPAKAEKKVLSVIAEKSKLSISGRAWAEFHNVQADKGSAANGVKVPSRWRVHNNSSYLRFKGETELMEGWKALAQIEAEFGIDGEEGTPFSSTRNTGVGLQSPYGTLILGRWDSPSKQTTIGLDPFGGTGIFGYYNIFGQNMLNAAGSNRWDRRLTNGLHYTSPDLYGAKLLASYAVGEVVGTTALPVDPYTINVALHYKRGPLFFGVSYETRNDCGNPDTSGANAGCGTAALGSATQPKGTDNAIRVGASYDIKQTWTKLAVAYEHIDLTAKAQAALPQKTLQRDVFWGVITQGIMSDNDQVILAYGMAGEASGKNVFTGLDGIAGTADDNKKNDGSYLTAAFRHYLSKDADVYVAYTQVMNGKNARYRIGSGSFPDTLPVGATSTGYGAGLRYFF